MSGMDESWNIIHSESLICHELIGIDLSREMNRKAIQKKQNFSKLQIEVRRQDVLESAIPDNSAEYIVSTFGLKTFSDVQLKKLAQEVNRILKPEAEFAFIEISKPKNTILLPIYMFYLKYLIPIIGRLFAGNADDYRMLGVYCDNFEDCSLFKRFLAEEGLHVTMKDYFFGCATGVVGSKRKI